MNFIDGLGAYTLGIISGLGLAYLMVHGII